MNKHYEIKEEDCFVYKGYPCRVLEQGERTARIVYYHKSTRSKTGWKVLGVKWVSYEDITLS